jgi:Lon protease-like protein
MAKLLELIESTSKKHPAAVAGVSGPAAVKLLRAVFGTLAQEINQAPDGAYKVAGLGVFRVRTVEAKADGKGGGRRVVFRAAKPGAKVAKTRKGRAAKGEIPEVSGSE